MSHLGAVSLLVRDYDEAIAFFVGKLGFDLSEDTDMGGGKRWVRVTPTKAARPLCCWPAPRRRNRSPGSAIRRAAGSGCSSTPTT